MELPWFIGLITFCLCFALKSLFDLIQHIRTINKPKLPPGPSTITILTSIRWIHTAFDLEPVLRRIHSRYGPIVTLQVGDRKGIYIASHDLAHKALIQQGATFADRPPTPGETGRILTSDQHNVSSAAYGPLWRLLRRNLSSEILHPSRVRSYAQARKWVLNVLKNKLKEESESGRKPVRVVDHFQYAMFCLLVVMCFGEKLDDKIVKQIEKAQRDMILRLHSFVILSFFPKKVGKLLFRNRWSEFLNLRSNQERVLLPLIKARQDKKNKQQQKINSGEDSFMVAYVDTLLNLSLPEDGGRKLKDGELVTLCFEFLNAGSDTTASALQWIMANLVKNQEIQKKLYNEIRRACTSEDGEIEEEELKKMPYLKGVVLEGLRRHPPSHFVASHAVTEDAILGGYVVPKDALINFTVAEMGCDPQVWEDPMVFKPERFVMVSEGGEGEDFDITGTREIKMMPFGAGRRICPGLGLAMLHLEFFVANLVKEFEWTAREGDKVDLSEKLESVIAMKYPLWAHLCPRI